MGLFKTRSKTTTRMHTAEKKGPYILKLQTYESKLLRRVRSPARNEGPWDGIPNRVLINLQQEFLTAIHDLFVLR